MGIDNPVAAIGDKSMAVFAISDHHLPGNVAFRKRPFHGAPRRRKTKRDHLHRQRKTTEHAYPFRIVGDHDHAIRRRRDDLFAQQGAAAPLMTLRTGSISSAPSTVRSSRSTSSSVVSGTAQRSASARVASEVGTPMTF